MTRDEHNRWRKNQQYFIEKESSALLRPLTLEETKKYEEALASGINPEVKVKGVICLVVRERELLKKEFIERFGSVALRRPNGQILKVLRDPAAPAPQYSPVMTNVPSPDQCACRSLEPAHKGRHHPTCEFNQRALPEQRATPEDFARYQGGTSLDFTDDPSPEVATFTRAPVGLAAPQSNVPHPLECVCREWGNYNPAKGKQHNPFCQHFDAWMAEHKSGFQLVSVATEKPLRAATIEEVKKASADIAHVITIGSEKFMVVNYDYDGALSLGGSIEFELEGDDSDTLPPPSEAEADTVNIGPLPKDLPAPSL